MYIYTYILIWIFDCSQSLVLGPWDKVNFLQICRQCNEVDAVKCWDDAGKHLGCSKCGVTTAECYYINIYINTKA